jgi:hypothetical protein
MFTFAPLVHHFRAHNISESILCIASIHRYDRSLLYCNPLHPIMLSFFISLLALGVGAHAADYSVSLCFVFAALFVVAP